MIAGQATRQAIAAAGDQILLIRPDGREATGQEVEARTTGLALALGKQGLAGQRIGLWSWNSAAAIKAHLATEWIGATRVPVDPGAPPAEAAAVCKAAGVAGVVVDAAHVTDAPAGALVHDDDSPLSATGTLEAREIPPSAGQSNPSPAYGLVATASRGGPPGCGWSRANAAVSEDEVVPAPGQCGRCVGDHLPVPLYSGCPL
jgi:acyl-CoA synthetase (AMP-forming)/AMP-acid ligase II